MRPVSRKFSGLFRTWSSGSRCVGTTSRIIWCGSGKPPTATRSSTTTPTPGSGAPGGTLWITSGLHLDLWDDASRRQLEGLKRRFLREFRPDEPFGSFAYPKYSDISYTVYGLLDQGMVEEARVLANISVRDTTRSNMFAEVYYNWEFPEPGGVRPSFFGAGYVMDMVLMNNGYRMDQGWPHLVRLHPGDGGVSNIRIRGKTLNLRLEQDSVRLEGSFVRARPDCRRLAVAVGETVAVSSQCAPTDSHG